MGGRFHKLAGILVLLSLGVFGCSGGGGDSSTSSTTGPDWGTTYSVAALSVAERVSIVDAQTEASLASAGTYYEIPWGTPFYTDPAKVWVGERSEEAFENVNNILCMLTKLGYEAMLNKGPYIAQVDMNKCENNNDVGQVDQSTGATRPRYVLWTVDSKRADSASPHIVHSWIDLPSDRVGDPDGLIYVKLLITEGKSEANPFGLFRLDFAGYPKNGAGAPVFINGPVMSGYIETEPDPGDPAKVLLYYSAENHEDEAMGTMSAVLSRGADSTMGSGGVIGEVSVETIPGSGIYNVVDSFDFDFVYNETHYLRKDQKSANEYCYFRKDYDENVWKYGLYDIKGNRLTRKSGFTVRADTEYGWVGYYGFWFPEEAGIVNGTTLYKQKYNKDGSVTEIPYSAFVAGGRLKKYTRGSVELVKIKNIPLDYSDGSQSYIAIWNGTTQTFQTTAFKDNNTGYTTAKPYEDIPLSGLNNLVFWAQALGGSVRVDLLDPDTGAAVTPDNYTSATIYYEETVYPGSVPADLQNPNYRLYCFRDCPNATPGIINSTSPFHADSLDSTLEFQPNTTPVNGVINAVSYRLDTASMELWDERSNAPVVLNEYSPASEWGALWTGALVVNTPANLSKLQCGGAASVSTCAWLAWNLPEFYTWETGPDQWTRMSAVQNTVDGTFVNFDQPLHMRYTHAVPDKYFGNTFSLEYAGFGQLWGIPGKCVDKDTGAETQCDQNTWWEPDFSIPTGARLEYSDPKNPGGPLLEAFAKALEKEQKMKKIDGLLPCQPGPYMPALVDYNPQPPAFWVPDIGPKPLVTDPPAIIDGESPAQ